MSLSCETVMAVDLYRLIPMKSREKIEDIEKIP